MFKKLLATLLALFAAAAFAAVDVNKASQADLETIKGIGPAIAGKILDERKKGSFKDWPDLIERVKGVGEVNSVKFSAEGLTVNGTAFKGAAPVAAKKEEKPTAKADDKKAAAPSADDKKAAAAKEKADKKAAKAAAAEQAKKDKEAKKATKSDKAASAAKPADAKASDAKPAKK
jgi:competence protein ComEA